jgi:ribosomal silencing factor RsfS
VTPKNPKEVTALNSHAALITEIAELRRHIWTIIAVGKQIAHTMPAKERKYLLDTLLEAERHLT